MSYPAGRDSNVALLGCSLAAKLHERHSSQGWFSSPGTFLTAQADRLMRAVCHTTSLQDSDTAVSCASSRKIRSQGCSWRWSLAHILWIIPRLGNVHRRNAFWQAYFLTGGSTQLSLVLKDFLQSRRWEKHHMWLGYSWLPPNLPSAYLQEWNLGVGKDHLSPFMSAVKCKRIREQILGFLPGETSTGD